ncbi:MAG: sulfite exporter TauE/SafE family protein [Woeseiaceae bacterium]|nr:sulfite exporter TauE/SafE family protein [Woeseiaceae bacterium]
MGLTGAVGGVLAGLLGVGGGIVVVPVLELVLAAFGVDDRIRMHMAVATSLATIVPTSMSSARAHYRKLSIDMSIVRRWAPFVVAGTVAGTVIASFVSGRALSGVFAVVALLVAVNMLFQLSDRRAPAAAGEGVAILAVPFGIGGVSTLMGIGGGTLSVLALKLLGRPIHLAVGTSALFGFFIAVPATLGYVFAGWGIGELPPWSLGYVSVAGALLIAPTSVLTAPLGARIAHALSRGRLEMLFGLFLLVVSLRMFWTTFG